MSGIVCVSLLWTWIILHFACGILSITVPNCFWMAIKQMVWKVIFPSCFMIFPNWQNDNEYWQWFSFCIPWISSSSSQEFFFSLLISVSFVLFFLLYSLSRLQLFLLHLLILCLIFPRFSSKRANLYGANAASLFSPLEKSDLLVQSLFFKLILVFHHLSLNVSFYRSLFFMFSGER